MMSREGAHRRAALIVNARARRGEHYAAKARRLLQAQGVEVAASYALRSPARLPETVHTALGRGYDLIILGGGDGTISAVVDDLAHHHAVLGVLPLGTANDFVRTLGIPTDLAEACATIAHGTVVDIDLGLADDNYYVNVASIGLGAAAIKALSPRLKRVAGTLAYPLATAHAFLGFEPFAATLTFPGGDHPPVTLPRLLPIAVGNGRFYGGGMAVAPQAGIDDGTLDVYAIEWGDWRRPATWPTTTSGHVVITSRSHAAMINQPMPRGYGYQPPAGSNGRSSMSSCHVADSSSSSSSSHRVRLYFAGRSTSSSSSSRPCFRQA
jgi:YegS/Rv2252/BmrU family lipid kinase